MIHEEICTYEVCKLAKEKGFPQHPGRNGKCRIYTLDKSKNTYVLCDWAVWISAPWASEVIAAPTQALLQRWLREEKALHIQITLWEKGWYYDIWAFEHYEEGKEYSAKMLHQSKDFTTYELALEDALAYSLKNLV